jgi:hypothetical protein
VVAYNSRPRRLRAGLEVAELEVARVVAAVAALAVDKGG